MLQPSSRLLSFLGTVAWGDLGPLTLYRSRRHRIVSFLKPQLEGPGSDAQTAHRNKFRIAKDAWNALDPETRAKWQKACTTLSLPLTGYNLWIFWKLTGSDDIITTIQRQSGQTLL